MNPKQAIQVLKQYTNQLRVTRDEHDAVWNAITVLEKQVEESSQREEAEKPIESKPMSEPRRS